MWCAFLPVHESALLRRANIKMPQDSTLAMDILALKDCTESFYEWYEGFEELEMMPHSFAVKFMDGQSWCMYADNEDEKVSWQIMRVLFLYLSLAKQNKNKKQDKLWLWLSEAAGIII